MLTALLLVTFMLPAEDYYHRAAYIELNHYTVATKRNGRVEIAKGDQYIVWVWDGANCRHQIAMWEPAERMGIRGFRGTYKLEYRRKIDIKVQAPRFVETWTKYDPEVKEREVLPTEFRLANWWRNPDYDPYIYETPECLECE